MAVEALLIIHALRPGLDVAGNEQGLVGDASDPASRLNFLQVPTEVALANGLEKPAGVGDNNVPRPGQREG